MDKRVWYRTAVAFVILGITIVAQSPSDMLSRILAEGTERSQAQRLFDTLTIDIGPRLTASPAHKKAVEFVRAELRRMASTIRGSSLEVRPRVDAREADRRDDRAAIPLIGYADGWSAPTSGEMVAAPVFIGGKSPEEVEAMRAQLKARSS